MFTMEIVPGNQALPVLARSGLLISYRDLPIGPEDVCRFLQLADTYALIGYRDGIPQGYVVCCKRIMERETPELFILQVAGDGGRGWVTEGWQQLHKFAARLGCHRIGAMFPVDRAPLLCRRFGFRPEGVFCVTPVRGEGAH